jgi:polyisoprenoid-binding protein YceI
MRPALLAFGVAAALAAPVVAQQMPTEPPGKADPSLVTAGRYAIDTAHTQVAFSVDHLGFNYFYGLFGGATGTMTLDPARPENASIDIEVPISGLLTTVPELTTHLKGADFFDAQRFPTARFRSTRVAVNGTSAWIFGNLTLHGVTKPVVLETVFTGAGPHPMNHSLQVGFEAKTTINRGDFGISYGLPMVGDETQLWITVAFEKQG